MQTQLRKNSFINSTGILMVSLIACLVFQGCTTAKKAPKEIALEQSRIIEPDWIKLGNHGLFHMDQLQFVYKSPSLKDLSLGIKQFPSQKKIMGHALLRDYLFKVTYRHFDQKLDQAQTVKKTIYEIIENRLEKTIEDTLNVDDYYYKTTQKNDASGEKNTYFYALISVNEENLQNVLKNVAKDLENTSSISLKNLGKRLANLKKEEHFLLLH